MYPEVIIPLFETKSCTNSKPIFEVFLNNLETKPLK